MSTLTSLQPSTHARSARRRPTGGMAGHAGRNSDLPRDLEPRAAHRDADGDAPGERQREKRFARIEAEEAVRSAKDRFGSARTTVVFGFPAHALIGEIRRSGTLVSVGSHGRGRAEGTLGSTAMQLVRDAPCSVLVAQEARDTFPRRIAVGVDGSPQSAAAYAAARYLADRFDSELAVVVAEGGEPLDLAGVSLIVGDRFRVIPDDPLRVPVAVSADSDLLVLGSRALPDLSALAKVSERVAHGSACSTLIVREE